MSRESDTASPNPDRTTGIEISDPAVMNKRPLVSVHMITYNHEPYIAQAIEGVLMQETAFPVELVVGEDCSTDRTREIVLDYQRRRPDFIRVLTTEHNVGMMGNSLRTAYACRGKYIAFCEGDDYWHRPRKLEKQVSVLESDPAVGLVDSGYDLHFIDTGRRSRWYPVPEKRSTYKDKFTMMLTRAYQYPHICTVCIRRDLLLSIYRDSPDAFSYEFLMADTQVWLEASRRAEMRRIGESLAVHNILPESVAHSRDPRRAVEFTRSGCKLLLKYAEKYNCPSDVKDAIILRHYRRLLRIASESRDVELAREASGKLEETRGRLTVRESLLLCGTTNTGVRQLLRLARGVRPMLRRAMPTTAIAALKRLRPSH